MKKSKDSIEIAKTDLQIQEELEAHKRGWSVQRLGVAFIFGLVLLAAAGVFGNGPASKIRITKEQVTVESERFYRFEARMELTIHVMDAQTDGVTVTFPNEYLQKFRVESILPEPKENKSTDGEVSYTFEGTGDVDITFHLSPRTQGTIAGEVSVNEKPFQLRTFIYP